MKFKPDFLPHVLGGLAVLVFAAAAAMVLLHLGLHPMTVAIVVAGIAAAVAVEGTQWNDNRLAKAKGESPPHEISGRDAFNSSLACLLAGAALEAATRLQLLSAWPG